MKKNNISSIIITIMSVVLIVLVGGCLYFYKESRKLDDSMSIGTPLSNNQISYGEAISSKNDFRTLQIALIKSISIDKPDIASNLPDATIKMDDYEQGICFLFADIWFDNDKVIFALGGKDIPDANYKELSGDLGKEVKECILKYKIK